jgi:NAD(P)-dependent dehydrogenase (short-subunit alcohol dehydrogenase family)
MAAAGANVGVADINLESARNTVGVASGPGRLLAIEADSGDVASIDAMVSTVVAEFGRVDVMVNNAGVTRPAKIMDVTEEDWDFINRVNSRGVFFCMQRVAREMIAQGEGRIINIGSIGGQGFVSTSSPAYAASKGAIIAFTKTAGQQLGQYGITVNAIHPGITITGMVERTIVERAELEHRTPEDVRGELENPIPIRRANSVADIGAMAVFLASPGARNITAQSINVDGGLIPG